MDFRKIGLSQCPSDAVNVMVEAPNPLGVHPTSMSYVYKVFQHLDMVLMSIRVHPYTVRPVEVGGRFWKKGVWLSPSDVVMS